MQEVADWFSAHPWGIVSLAICTIAGTAIGVIGVVLHFTGRKDKRPCYAVRSYGLISGAATRIPELEIHFRGHGPTIENLTVSKLIFWNNGRAVIRKADIPKGPSIVISLAGD